MNGQSILRTVLICGFAFLEAMVAKGFYNGQATAAILDEAAEARTLVGLSRPHSIQVTKSNGSVLKYIYGADGNIQMDQGIFRDQPISDFTDAGYKLRLQMGTYPGDVRSNETGLPVVTLYDWSSDLKELFRLDGRNQAPLIIFKTHETNRVIMGLSINDSDEEPFLAYFDKRGGKHMLFGNF